MPETLDVYRDWLGIKETARPLNHYQLLRIKQFEDDTAKIRGNYRKLNAHVRKYAAGQFSAQSQELLNELAKSMLCLTDARRKSEYDASLGRKTESKKGRTLEEILISQKAVDTEQLQKARNYSKAVGVDIQTALVQQKLAPADVVVQAYAESIGLPFVDLSITPIDELLAPKVPAILARQNSCVPVMIDDNNLLMASPLPLNPNVEEELRLRFEGMSVRTVLCTAAGVNGVINQFYTREAADAEMASQSVGAKQKAQSSGGSSDAAPALSKEEIAKQKKTLALVVFNFCVMATVLGAYLTGFTLGMTVFGLAILIGGAGAGVSYLMGPKG